MILPIEVYGSPVLRKKSAEITADYPDLPKFIESMFETMYKAEGVGLAAPQVGRNIRLFIIDGNVMVEDYPELAGFKKAFINPTITNIYGDEWCFSEGCLSVPGMREDVYRASTIDMKYMDEQGNWHSETFDGIKARIIQHEYDHLEGILYVDKINPLKRKMISNKLNNITKGKFDAKYKVRKQ